MNAAADAISPSTETQEFLTRKHKLLIDGQWVDSASGDTITVEDPATEQTIGEVAIGGAEDI
ncbi:MAG: betaine-aldehyde dehydrogenase, partial [Gammaproteobacteria bacterium]|nr:betaine-aldehyde dehydrogenase [Gammaproteobacteria bacterium]